MTELEKEIEEATALSKRLAARYISLVEAGRYLEGTSILEELRSLDNAIAALKLSNAAERKNYTERERTPLNKELFQVAMDSMNVQTTKRGVNFWGKYEVGAAIDKLLEDYDVTKKSFHG